MGGSDGLIMGACCPGYRKLAVIGEPRKRVRVDLWNWFDEQQQAGLDERACLPDTEISFFGIAVAIMLGFRNNEAYNRYWEARTAWGDLTNASRNFACQVMGYIQPPKEYEQSPQGIPNVHSELIYRHLAFLNALRLQLRKEDKWEELKPFLSDSEFLQLNKTVNKATLFEPLAIPTVARTTYIGMDKAAAVCLWTYGIH